MNNLEINCIVSSTYVASKNALYLLYSTSKEKKNWFLLDSEINYYILHNNSRYEICSFRNHEKINIEYA